MVSAVCIKCGSEKEGAFSPCRHCKASPRTEKERCLSLILSEHISSKSQLATYAQDIKNKVCKVPAILLEQAMEALKDPQLLAMVGISSSAPSANLANLHTQSPPAQNGKESIPSENFCQKKKRISTLHKNPFWLLGATSRDDRRRIVELAEEKSLKLDYEVCQKARSDLTTPRNRLSAEMAWFPGLSPKRAFQLANQLLQDPMSVRTETGLPSLAHANLMAAAFEALDFENSGEDVAEFIQQMANLVDEDLAPEDIMRDINEDRNVSGFPEVKSADLVEAELVERKRYFRNVIKEALDRLPTVALIEVMIQTVDSATSGGEIHAPELIDELVDSYELETKAFLQEEAENISKVINAARQAAKSGEAAVKPLIDKIEQVAKNWKKVATPIQLSAKARGLDHEPSNELAYSIRSLAIDLCNEHEMLTQSRHITTLLQELFAECPEVKERVEQDVNALQELMQKHRETEVRREEWAQEITYRAEVGMVFKDQLSISPEEAVWRGQRYPLEAITRVRWGGIRHSTNGIPTGTAYTIAFGDDRSEAVVELRREGIYSNFIERLWKAVGVRLLVELLETLKSGKEIEFGDAFLKDDSITLERHKFIGANEMVRCGWHQVHIWSADGSFYIGAKDDKKTYAKFPYIDLPNTHILEHAIRIAFKKPGLQRLSDLLK